MKYFLFVKGLCELKVIDIERYWGKISWKQMQFLFTNKQTKIVDSVPIMGYFVLSRHEYMCCSSSEI